MEGKVCVFIFLKLYSPLPGFLLAFCDLLCENLLRVRSKIICHLLTLLLKPILQRDVRSNPYAYSIYLIIIISVEV